MNKLPTTKISDMSETTNKEINKILEGIQQDYYVIENIVPRTYTSLLIFNITKYVPSYTVYKMKENRQSICLLCTDSSAEVQAFLYGVKSTLLQ